MIAAFFWLCVGSILYTYIGYPLVLWLLVRHRPTSVSGTLAAPPVTLLIAAYNEASSIARKLENSLELDYPPERLHILVAADGSDDATVQIVRSFAERGVELSYSPERRGKMAAINRAMPRARGEIVVFSDANNMYESNVLKELVTHLGDATVGAVTGAKVIARGDGVLGDYEGLYWKYESFIKESETRLGNCTGVAGEILAIRRDLYEPPPDHIINDDFYIAMHVIQRGFRVVYAPRAVSLERVSATAKDEMIRRARIAAGRFQAIALAGSFLRWKRPLVAWQVISHKFMRPLVPIAMIGALIANMAATIWPSREVGATGWLQLAPPVSWALLIAQLTFFGLAWVGRRVGKRGRIGRMLYLPTFLVDSNMAALAGLIRLLTLRETAVWRRARRTEEAGPAAGRAGK